MPRERLTSQRSTGSARVSLMRALSAAATALLIAQPALHALDPRQDALDRLAIALLPLFPLRSPADDAGGLQVGTARAHGGIERQIELLEQAAEHLHRPLEDVLVAQLDPLGMRNARLRFQGKPVGARPLEGAHLFQARAVVVAPAGRQEEVPLAELAAVDRNRLGR